MNKKLTQTLRSHKVTNVKIQRHCLFQDNAFGHFGVVGLEVQDVDAGDQVTDIDCC